MITLTPFHGGVHPPMHKERSTQQKIIHLPLPTRLVIPLRQNIGSRPKCLVNPGQYVKKGQKIAEADGLISVALHAPTSGLVSEIIEHVVAHPSGLQEPCVVILPDGEDNAVNNEPIDISQWEGADIRRYLQEMGIVGLGGATFPSHIKCNHQTVETLIINGAECEPYITCDDMLMRERAEEIVAGIAILKKILAPQSILIGIEDNKPEAIAALEAACLKQGNIATVKAVPTIYPSGGAKQLIKLLTNKEIPWGKRAPQLGVQCFNVATVYSIHRAVNIGEPLISRIVTVTGNVQAPANYQVLIGTPLDELVWHAAPDENTDGYIMGGSMMGFRVPSCEVPISKASNCFIATSPQLFPPPSTILPCIRCGECAKVCPAELQPQDLYWFAKAKDFKKAQDASLFDCIECGACAYVCPSHLPLVDYYRFAKSEIWAEQARTQAAHIAKERYEFHSERVSREKAEKAERLALKAKMKEALLAQTQETTDVRTAKIQAIMEAAALKTEKSSLAQLEKQRPPIGDQALTNLDAQALRGVSEAIKKAASVAKEPYEDSNQDERE